MNQASTSLQDDTFSKLESIFLASGKGRRPSLPELPVLTSRLLQQVLLLKEKGGKSFDDAAAFLHRLFPGESLATLRYQLVRASGSETVKFNGNFVFRWPSKRDITDVVFIFSQFD